MENIENYLNPSLHGLLFKFVREYIEGNNDNFEQFGTAFFHNLKGAKISPKRSNSAAKDAISTLMSDPAALYKLVECDPDVLYLRDKLKFFVLACLMNNPKDIIEQGIEYFGTIGKDESGESHDKNVSELRRKSVYVRGYDPENDDETESNAIFDKTPEETDRLRNKIKHALLFRSLDTNQMNEVLSVMFKLNVEKGSCVIRQGDDGDYFYVVDEGVFEAYVKESSGTEKKVSTYRGGGSFGELALLYNMPRVATVKATTGGSLWCLDRNSFRKIVVRSAFKKRQMYEKFIQSVPVLKVLNDYERQSLADALQPMVYEDGESIIKQSEEGTGMYFVEDGTVIFSYTNADGKSSHLTKVGRGGFFGELALIMNKPRAVSAYASGQVRVAFIDRESFERLLGPCHELMKRAAIGYENELKKLK